MNCTHVVATSIQGCGTIGAFSFFNAIGRPYVWEASQFATSPEAAVVKILGDGGTLDDAWDTIVAHCESASHLRGFTGWPYNLFWKQWDGYVHYQPKFIHWTRPAQDWAKVELAFQLMRGVAPEIEGYHIIRQFIFGDTLTYDSTVADWQRWVDAYHKWNNDIKAYFAGKDNFLEIDPENEDSLELANRICVFLGIENIASTHYPDRGAVGGERYGLLDETGWDDTFTGKWNEYKPLINWDATV